MGVDISMFAEVRRPDGWVPAEPLQRNTDYWFDEEAPRPEPRLMPTRLYSVRNYAVFAILADVRNPVRAVTPFECISEPRGLPPDVSRPVRDWRAAWGEGAFADSWLTLEDLLAFDWHGKEIVRRGMVDPTAAHLFPPGRRGFPLAEWPEGVKVSVAEWMGGGVEVRWIETYAEAAGEEFVAGALGALRSYGPPRDVRVVFWFDQ